MHHLGCRHAAAFACKGSDKSRIANAAKRVVDAVKEYVANAFFNQPGESAALGECSEAPAIAIGHQGQTIVFVNDGFPVRVKRANRALFKETNIFAGVTEKVVLGKEVDGRFVIQRARHDAPRNRMAYLGGQVLQAFCLQLEQTLVARESDIEHALRAIETEAGT